MTDNRLFTLQDCVCVSKITCVFALRTQTLVIHKKAIGIPLTNALSVQSRAFLVPEVLMDLGHSI